MTMLKKDRRCDSNNNIVKKSVMKFSHNYFKKKETISIKIGKSIYLAVCDLYKMKLTD